MKETILCIVTAALLLLSACGGSAEGQTARTTQSTRMPRTVVSLSSIHSFDI